MNKDYAMFMVMGALAGAFLTMLFVNWYLGGLYRQDNLTSQSPNRKSFHKRDWWLERVEFTEYLNKRYGETAREKRDALLREKIPCGAKWFIDVTKADHERALEIGVLELDGLRLKRPPTS